MALALSPQALLFSRLRHPLRGNFPLLRRRNRRATKGHRAQGIAFRRSLQGVATLLDHRFSATPFALRTIAAHAKKYQKVQYAWKT